MNVALKEAEALPAKFPIEIVEPVPLMLMPEGDEELNEMNVLYAAEELELLIVNRATNVELGDATEGTSVT